MSVSVLVPYGYGGPERAKAWAWLEQRWRLILPDAELLVESGAENADPGRFDKGVAVNRCAARASGDVFVIADADTAPDPVSLRVALDAGVTVFVARYVALSREQTKLALRLPAESELWHFDAPILETSVGGIVVTPRSAFETVGGLDERAKGWGGIDAIYAHAIATLCGPYARAGSCWHLWHPRPAANHHKAPYFAETNALLQRYSDVAGDPAAMRALIGEARA